MNTVIIILLVVAGFVLSMYHKKISAMPFMPFVFLAATIYLAVQNITGDRSLVVWVFVLLGLAATIRSVKLVREKRSGRS